MTAPKKYKTHSNRFEEYSIRPNANSSLAGNPLIKVIIPNTTP